MPSLLQAQIRNCVVCLDSLQKLHDEFIAQPQNAGDIVARLDDVWKQIEASHSWVSSNFQVNQKIAVLAQSFATYCADNGNQLVEIHRPSTTRILWLRTAHAAARLQGNHDIEARIGYNLGVIQVARSEFEEAEILLQESRDYFQKHQYFEHHIASLNALALLAKHAGQFSQAVDLHSMAHDTAVHHGLLREAAVSAQQLGRALKSAGRIEEAIRRQVDARLTFEKLQEHTNSTEILIDQARDAFEQGDAEGAGKFCDEVLVVFRAGKIIIDGSMMHHRFGALLLDFDHPETDAFIQESLNAAREVYNKSLEGCLLQLQSLRECKRNHLERALDLCDQSISTFEVIGAEYGIDASKKLLSNLQERFRRTAINDEQSLGE